MLKLDGIKRDHLIKIFLNFTIFFGFNYVLAYPSKVDEWKTVVAHFEINKFDIKDLKFDNTLLEVLVKESGEKIDNYLDEDKEILRFFKIKYRALIKLEKDVPAREEDIIQYGLFKALPMALLTK